MQIDESDGTLILTAEDAKRLAAELGAGGDGVLDVAKFLGDHILDVLKESDPLERVIFIRVLP